MLGARAAMAEPLGERARKLEQPLRLGRDTERAARPRRRRAEALDDARADGLRRDPERLQRAGGHLLGLSEQAEEEMLRPDVVMAECARFGGGARERGACGRVQTGWPRPVPRRRDGDEALLRRLLCDAERASDLGPAAAGRARLLDEVVDEFVGDGPHALAELDRRGQSRGRRGAPTLRLDRADEALES